jgi:hypothetical protein
MKHIASDNQLLGSLLQLLVTLIIISVTINVAVAVMAVLIQVCVIQDLVLCVFLLLLICCRVLEIHWSACLASALWILWRLLVMEHLLRCLLCQPTLAILSNLRCSIHMLLLPPFNPVGCAISTCILILLCHIVLPSSPCAGRRGCPYSSAVPNHRHVLWSRIMDLCLFLDISDITDLFWTFLFQTPVLLDWLCLLRVA